VASTLGVFYRLSTVLFSSVRKYRLLAKGSLCDDFDIQIVSLYTYFGDWLVLHQLSKNMDPLIFADILRDLAHQLKENGKKSFKLPRLREDESKIEVDYTDSVDVRERHSTNGNRINNIYDLVPNENYQV